MTRTGRCLCGKVSYELTGDLIATAVCHCHRCQRQSGSAFSVNLMAHESQLSVSGDLSAYIETGENDDGEYVSRKFCAGCGSPIVSEILGSEGVIALKAGTLDDRSDVLANVEVWCADKQPWVELSGMAISLDQES